MIIGNQDYYVNGLHYTIRSAVVDDAGALSELRLQIDGETENMDREQGEAFIDTPGFEMRIRADSEAPRDLFLVAAVQDRLIGFSRCEGIYLKRFSHKVEFGVCVLKAFWGHGVGKNLLRRSIGWADANGIKKMTLNVTETNVKAMELYKKFGFEIEGVLKSDKRLADGKLYSTIAMGRFRE